MRKWNKIRKKLVFLCMAMLITGSAGIATPLQVEAAPEKAEKVTSVTLNYNAYVLKQNQTLKLKATCLPKTAKKVTWKSSNRSVATVSSGGKVTAKKTGTAKITAVTGDGSNRKAVCTVKVVNKITRITKLKISTSGKTMMPGEKFTLKAKLKPVNATLKTLNWESSDNEVATVSKKGVVKALKPGTARITAKAQDGSKKKVTCTIKVNKIPVSQLALADEAISLRAGKTCSLAAVVAPSNATVKDILWKSSDDSIARVDAQGVITAVAEGTATITASTTDGSGLSDSCKVKVLPAVEPAMNHKGAYYVYELDRNALQYQKVYREPGKESVSYTDRTEVSNGMWKYALAVRNGIQSEEAFYKLLESACKENAFALFGAEDVQIKGHASDYTSVTLQTTASSGTKTIVLENIKVVSKKQSVKDQNGTSTYSSKVEFTIDGEKLIMEVYFNGSKLALYRPSYSQPHFEIYVDNMNYKYVIRMTQLFNAILMGKIDTFPNFKYLDMYNIY